MGSNITGTVKGFELPGGEIGWAAGTQWRQTERRNLIQPEDAADRAFELQACPWPGDPNRVSLGLTFPGERLQAPGDLGCTNTGGNGPGVYLAAGRSTIDYLDQQTISYYGQVDLPVLSNLNFQASARREDYNGGDLIADIWNVAGKWDITNNFYLRSDYGKDVRAQGLDARPGETTVSSGAATFAGRFPGNAILILDVTDTSIEPEDDRTFNFGGGFQSDDLFGGRIRAEATFFEIIIDGELAGGALDTGALTTVMNAVFGPSQSNINTPVLIGPGVGCSSPLIGFLLFDPAVNGGQCSNATTGANVAGIIRVQTNGGGFITNGVDYSLDYCRPLFNGTLRLQGTATNVLVYKTKGYDIGGIPFQGDGDRLGYRNQNPGSGASNSREWRIQATARWSNTIHTASLTANYQSGVKDGGYAACSPPYYDTSRIGLTNPGPQTSALENFWNCGDSLTAVNINPATGSALVGPTAYSTYGVDTEGLTTFNATYIYRPQFLEGFELRASVINLTDEDPVPDQTRRGFSTGDPRGRIIELELKKEF